MKRIIKFISPGAYPFSIFCILLIFIILYRSFDLPTPEKLNASLRNLYLDYGLIIVLISAVIESLFIIGIYLPGSLAIILAVYYMGTDVNALFNIGLICYFGFLLSFFLNYQL